MDEEDFNFTADSLMKGKADNMEGDCGMNERDSIDKEDSMSGGGSMGGGNIIEGGGSDDSVGGEGGNREYAPNDSRSPPPLSPFPSGPSEDNE